MSRFGEISRLTGIQEWWFEVATGERPLLSPPVTSLPELRTYSYQAPDDSEEKFSGYIHWVEVLTVKSIGITTLEEAMDILKYAPPWFTLAAFKANNARNRFEADKHPQAYRREYLEQQGTIANFFRQLELAETYEECYEIFSFAQTRCVVALSTILEKMLRFATSMEELKEIHDRSLPWYPTKLESLWKMVDLFKKGQLKS